MAQQQNDEVDQVTQATVPKKKQLHAYPNFSSASTVSIQLSGLTFVSNKPNTTHEHYLKVAAVISCMNDLGPINMLPPGRRYSSC